MVVFTTFVYIAIAIAIIMHVFARAYSYFREFCVLPSPSAAAPSSMANDKVVHSHLTRLAGCQFSDT